MQNLIVSTNLIILIDNKHTDVWHVSLGPFCVMIYHNNISFLGTSCLLEMFEVAFNFIVVTKIVGPEFSIWMYQNLGTSHYYLCQSNPVLQNSFDTYLELYPYFFLNPNLSFRPNPLFVVKFWFPNIVGYVWSSSWFYNRQLDFEMIKLKISNLEV